MTIDDLDNMASLLGDPAVMTYYPHPKTRDEARAWIEWNLANYREHGYGLWILETEDGQFVGDCGLTWQPVWGSSKLEVGYHVARDLQRQGYATEAARACSDFARDIVNAAELVAIVHPENIASQRVAEKIGLAYLGTDGDDTAPIRTVIYGRSFWVPPDVSPSRMLTTESTETASRVTRKPVTPTRDRSPRTSSNDATARSTESPITSERAVTDSISITTPRTETRGFERTAST
jgi:RimJ/RimL family protein N-acetyltransferase